MEESMVHEKNFRESITMLVIQNTSSGDEQSLDENLDADIEQNNEQYVIPGEQPRFEKDSATPMSTDLNTASTGATTLRSKKQSAPSIY